MLFRSLHLLIQSMGRRLTGLVSRLKVNQSELVSIDEVKGIIELA